MPSGLNELDGVEKILEFVAVRQFSEPLEIFRADAPCRVDLFLDLFQTLKSCNGAVVLGSVRGTHHFRQGVLVGLELGDDTGFRQAKPPPTPLMPDKIFGAVELPGTDGTTGANRLVPKLIEFFFVFTGEEQAGSENSMGEGILAGGRLPLYRFRPGRLLCIPLVCGRLLWRHFLRYLHAGLPAAQQPQSLASAYLDFSELWRPKREEMLRYTNKLPR